ncbi:MAG: hypothetical protein HRT38_05965 [Alteromonadaceae bacterium]|nr:hypothetical protein [Alteromonadaceae bacterium]
MKKIILPDKLILNMLIVSVFAITLQSFYFPGLGAIVTYLGAVLIVVISIFTKKISLDIFKSMVPLFLILMVYYLVLIFKGGGSSSEFNSLLSISAMLLLIPFYPLVLRKHLLTVLASVILIHSLIIIFQMFFWVLTREYIDFLQIAVGESSRVMSSKGLTLFNMRVPRFAGLFNEPGTYSVIIMSLTLVYYSVLKKINLTVVMASLTSLFTLSMFGIVLVASLFLVHIIRSKKLNVFFLIFLSILFASLYYVGFLETILNRFSESSNYGGISFREMMLRFYFNNAEYIIFGIPMGDYPDYFVANDVGLWFAFLVAFGLIGFGIVILMIGQVYYKKSLFEVVIFILLLFTKLKFTYPLFWFLYALLLFKDHGEKDGSERFPKEMSV